MHVYYDTVCVCVSESVCSNIIYCINIDNNCFNSIV